MNFDRIYEYRFKGIDKKKKQVAWQCISTFIYEKLNYPKSILDPAAGLCEFINNVPSQEKWCIDLNRSFLEANVNKDVNLLIGNNLEVEIQKDFFEGIFVSNFLEHLDNQDQVATFLRRMYESMKPKGRIAIMGPNFKYCYKNYFDFADHKVLLSELGVAEHLYGAGFNIIRIYPRFLPLSFRGGFPVSKLLVETYLKIPFFWRVLGKQFLVIAEK